MQRAVVEEEVEVAKRPVSVAHWQMGVSRGSQTGARDSVDSGLHTYSRLHRLRRDYNDLFKPG